MKNRKMTLIELLEREFKGETFTRFAVMSWHHEGELTQWNNDFDTLVKSGELVKGEMRPLGAVYTRRNELAICWNCCPDQKEPDWSPYNALELAGCIQQGDYVERVEEDTTPTFYTIYGHLIGGGCEALHDWPDGYRDIVSIREQCAELGERLGFTVWDMVA